MISGQILHDTGNNRGVPIPEKLEAADYREVQVGNLRFELQKIHAHERGDLSVFLDKTIPENAAEGSGGKIGQRGKERGGVISDVVQYQDIDLRPTYRRKLVTRYFMLSATPLFFFINRNLHDPLDVPKKNLGLNSVTTSCLPEGYKRAADSFSSLSRPHHSKSVTLFLQLTTHRHRQQRLPDYRRHLPRLVRKTKE